MSFVRGFDDEIKAVQRLASHIRSIPRLAAAVGLEDADEDSWAIATGLRDLNQASHRIFDELVPELLSVEPGSPDAERLLYAIGEEYRHILYHVTATRFFSYLSGSTPDAEDR